MKTQLVSAIMRAWMRRGWLAYLLWPVAQLAGVVIWLRAWLYQRGWLRQQKLPVPVIVVGNIFVGGTGKTPLTLWLLNQLKAAGYQPGVVSRGYGAKRSASRIVLPESVASEVGDEPVLLAQRSACPVVVGRNRGEAARLLLTSFPNVNVIVADDGLQHLALARDVEIMLFDSRGVGNGWLLPAGPLREPVTRRRDFTVVNLNSDEPIPGGLGSSDVIHMQLTATAAQRLLDASQTQPLSTLNTGLKIVAAAGIGHPERFFTMLRQQGVCCSSLPLPDHFDYRINPFAQITKEAADMILITEKDAVKCRLFDEIARDPRIWVVAAQAQVEAGAFEKILKKLK